ncbi:putative equilibrative nucleoside transporter [Helianthus annuus]|nr:putative equilibrative nucleoside transporter [Helianthus annuus]
MSIRSNFWQIVKKIWYLVTAVFAIYLVSLSIFPGYLSENVASTYFKDWYPILLITTFNVGDFVGKCLTVVYVPRGSRMMVWWCMGKVLFYPLFVGCVHGPKWMHSEGPVMSLTMMLGVSNGYLTSVLWRRFWWLGWLWVRRLIACGTFELVLIAMVMTYATN